VVGFDTFFASMKEKPATNLEEARRREPTTTCKQWPSSGCTEFPVRATNDGTARLAVSAALLLMAAGCVAPPQISVTDVAVVEVGEEASQLAIRVTLENNDDVPVKLDMWDYRFTMGSQSYAGRWSAGITLPPKQTVSASIPAVVGQSASLGSGSAWQVGGHVTFLAPSRLAEALFELGLNRPSASFSGRGDTIGQGGEIPSAAGPASTEEQTPPAPAAP